MYMQTYFSTFVPGTEKIIEKALAKRRGGNIEILRMLDGLVLYRTSYSPQDVRGMRFFNNSFILLYSSEGVERSSIEAMMNYFLRGKKTLQQSRGQIPKKARRFKIVTSLENRTIATERSLLEKFEQLITRQTKLALNIPHPDVEFWFLTRREGYGFFGMRITNIGGRVRKISAGELHPELAHILCLVSQPRPDDVFLDPFAGRGAIALERAVAFPYKRIIAGDISPVFVEALKRKSREIKKTIDARELDALLLSGIPDASIDKIVTDPPWGIYRKVEDGFYEAVLVSLLRVLKDDGLIVLLMADKTGFENALKMFSGRARVLEKHDILVSGKKAAVYKVKKTASSPE